MLRHKSVVHEGKRPFVCDSCGSAFSEAAVLRKHKLSVHEAWEDKVTVKREARALDPSSSTSFVLKPESP
ncbi:hypothetical protein FBUS_02138 [Fasciolopsis buskii]|uniref:C2H2-type domain-containing protein n=1 Tax=Fasciolopsis buskii TaxID=27845 RepID=A0A8E0RXD5_9TREM|nr:hypothetical protein FBUS_02138 [Fasciolopsis buski]